MSYDLSVFAPGSVAAGDLVEAVLSVPGLAIENPDEVPSGLFHVVRGAKRAHAFSVEGRVEIEPEDAPDGVAEYVLGASCMVQIFASLDGDAARKAAIRVAKALAKASGGVVYDEQTGEVWSTNKKQALTSPAAAYKTDVLELRFYSKTLPSAEFRRVFYEAASRMFPELTPLRYGKYRPYPHRVVEGEESDFFEYSTVDRLVSFTSKYPLGYGYFGVGDDLNLCALKLLLDVRAVSDRSVLSALRALFLTIAREAECYFADAQTVRNCIWRPKAISYVAESEFGGPAVSQESVRGLPHYPSWWTWTGLEYADVISPQQPSDGTRFGDFTFYEAGPMPMNTDQVQESLVDPGKPWVPSEYQMKVSHENNFQGPADVIPESLR